MHGIISAQYASPEPEGGYKVGARVIAVHSSYGVQERYVGDSNEGGGMQAFVNSGGVIDPYVEAPETTALRVVLAKQAVVAFADELASQITGPVPDSEKLAWIKKEDAARAHIAGTATASQAALLQGELDLTGAIDVDLDGLAAKIVANADFYSAAVATIAGVRRATMASIDALGDTPTQAQIDAVLSAARLQAESAFNTLMQSAP
jgi:hypothetical protein